MQASRDAMGATGPLKKHASNTRDAMEATGLLKSMQAVMPALLRSVQRSNPMDPRVVMGKYLLSAGPNRLLAVDPRVVTPEAGALYHKGFNASYNTKAKEACKQQRKVCLVRM